MLHILYYPVSIIGQTIVKPGKIFRIKVLRRFSEGSKSLFSDWFLQIQEMLSADVQAVRSPQLFKNYLILAM